MGRDSGVVHQYSEVEMLEAALVSARADDGDKFKRILLSTVRILLD